MQITGGGGAGATARATFDAASGLVTGIVITNPGTGYTGTPTVTLMGGGATSAATVGTVSTAANSGGGLTKTGAGTLTLNGSNSYSGGTTVSAGTLQVGNVNAMGTGALTVNGGTLDLHNFSPSVGALSGAGGDITTNASGTSTLTTTVASGSATYSGNITNGSGAVTLTKAGAGTLALGGSLSIARLNANNGVTQLAQSGSIAAVSIADGATVAMAAHSGSTWNVLDTSSLAFSGPAGSIDIGNNAMIVRATGLSDLATKVALVQSKVNAAADLLALDGQGITASAVLDDLQVNGVLTIMVYDNSQLYLDTFAGVSGLGSFDEVTGDPIDFNQVLLKVTYLGDLNGDGMVDGSDYGYMDYYFQSTLVLGDLNGDGIVDGSDYGLLDYGFQTQVYGVLNGGGSAVPQAAGATAGTGAAPASPEAVPEPGVAGLLLAGALGLLGFRRCKKNRA